MGKIADTWFAVVNPAAGSGKTLAQWRKAERILYQHKIKYIFVTPESVSHSSKLISDAAAKGYRNFIAVGGDGTVHQIIRSLFQYCEKTADSHDKALALLKSFKLAVLPIGSGNDWIRSHNIPKDHEAIIEMIARGEFKYQDVAKAEILDPCSGESTSVSYMANVGGYNFDANVCDVVNFQKANGIAGKMMYFKAVLKIAFKQKATRTAVWCDGKKVFDEDCYTISIGNGLYSGGGLRQTPAALMDDGLLNLMVAPRFPMWLLFFHVHKLLTGHTDRIPFLKFFTGAKIEIVPEGQGQLVEIDGDIIGRAPVRVEIIPRCLNVLHKG